MILEINHWFVDNVHGKEVWKTTPGGSTVEAHQIVTTSHSTANTRTACVQRCAWVHLKCDTSQNAGWPAKCPARPNPQIISKILTDGQFHCG